MNRTLNIIVGIMLCLILLASVRNYSWLKLGVGQVYYLGGYTLTALSVYALYINKKAHTITYLAPFLYLIWALIGIYRGIFELNSGWIVNQYFHNVLAVIVPIIIFLFAFPETIIHSFQIFNIFSITFSVLSFGWNYNTTTYGFAFTHFYYIYLCFIVKIPKFWRYITYLAILLVIADGDNRSSHIKVLSSLSVLLMLFLPRMIQKYVTNIIHWLLYIIPLIFFYLGVTGHYNVFQGNRGENSYVTINSNGIEEKKQDFRVDTRTFLYEEVFASMVINDYVWTGRTPARGYYSPYFAESSGYIAGRNYGERISSEVGHLNTLHWLGVIGLVLLTLVYLQGSFLALYRSKNKYVKCLSLAVAFQWLWSWVENSNNFLMLDVMIYVMLAICYSPYFRKMSDLEFEMWFKSIFQWPSVKLHDYNKYQLVKTLMNKKVTR